jgi:hypothetical protein
MISLFLTLSSFIPANSTAAPSLSTVQVGTFRTIEECEAAAKGSKYIGTNNGPTVSWVCVKAGDLE